MSFLFFKEPPQCPPQWLTLPICPLVAAAQHRLPRFTPWLCHHLPDDQRLSVCPFGSFPPSLACSVPWELTFMIRLGSGSANALEETLEGRVIIIIPHPCTLQFPPHPARTPAPSGEPHPWTSLLPPFPLSLGRFTDHLPDPSLCK